MELVQAGQFRLDLHYRLNGLALSPPALRERLDKADLIEAVLREEARSLQRDAPHVAANAMGALLGHAWPGNIRELKSALRAALALSDGDSIGLEHLPAGIVGCDPECLAAATLVITGLRVGRGLAGGPGRRTGTRRIDRGVATAPLEHQPGGAQPANLPRHRPPWHATLRHRPTEPSRMTRSDRSCPP